MCKQLFFPKPCRRLLNFRQALLYTTNMLLVCPLNTHQNLQNHCVHNVSVLFLVFVASLDVSPEYPSTFTKSLCTQCFCAFSGFRCISWCAPWTPIKICKIIVYTTFLCFFWCSLFLLMCPLNTHQNLQNHCVHNVSVLFLVFVVSLDVPPEYPSKSAKSLCTQCFCAFFWFSLFLLMCPLNTHQNLQNHCVHNVSVLFLVFVASLDVSPECPSKSGKALCTQRFCAFSGCRCFSWCVPWIPLKICKIIVYTMFPCFFWFSLFLFCFSWCVLRSSLRCENHCVHNDLVVFIRHAKFLYHTWLLWRTMRAEVFSTSGTALLKCQMFKHYARRHLQKIGLIKQVVLKPHVVKYWARQHQGHWHELGFHRILLYTTFLLVFWKARRFPPPPVSSTSNAWSVPYASEPWPCCLCCNTDIYKVQIDEEHAVDSA